MKKEIMRLINFLKPFLIFILIVACVIMVIIIAMNQEDPSKQVMADLKEEFKAHGVRFLVQAEISSVVLEQIDTKAEFIQLIDRYQPKIVYYRYSMRDVRFCFFEDEAETVIAYKWIYDFGWYATK